MVDPARAAWSGCSRPGRRGAAGRAPSLLALAAVLSLAARPATATGSAEGGQVPVVRSGHVIVEPLPERGIVTVSEVWAVAGEPRGTQAGTETDPIRLELPAGATDLQLDEDTLGSAVLEGGTLVDRSPLTAAGRRLVLQYVVPYEGSSVVLDRRLDMDVDGFRVMVAAESATIEGTGLGAPNTEQADGGVLVAAEGRSLAAGSTLSLRIGGLPAATGDAQAAAGTFVPVPTPWVDPRLIAAFGVGLALLGVLVVAAYPSGGPGDRRVTRQMAYEESVERIAALDDLHAVGSLTDREHSVRRAPLLRRALELVPQDQGDLR